MEFTKKAAPSYILFTRRIRENGGIVHDYMSVGLCLGSLSS